MLENDLDVIYFFYLEKDEDESEGYSILVLIYDIWKKFEFFLIFFCFLF